MKSKTIIAIAAAAGLLGVGAAAVTLPAEAPSAQTTAATIATPTPEVRTEVVHRRARGRDHAEDGPHRSSRHRAASVAAPAVTAAPVVVDDDRFDDHGGDDDRFDDHGGDDDSGHGGHGRDHPEDD